MGVPECRLTPPQRRRLEQLAARLVLGEGHRPEAIVRAATELVADGVDVEGLIQLACQPTDVTAIDGQEVEILFRAALAEVGLRLPSRETAGWTLVRWIAASVIEGGISPGDGAGRIWGLAGECGHAHELVEMLQLHDAWESSVGADRIAVEADMLDFAPDVVAAADRHLAADRPPSSPD